MTREAYWDYLDDIGRDINERYPLISRDARFILLKLTASPYYFWLRNKTLNPSTQGMGTSIPPGSSQLPDRPDRGDPPNLFAVKATEIRTFVREHINDKEHKHLTKSAVHVLELVLREHDTDYIAKLPDDVVVAWYENWVEKAKA